jgi:single-strand DNA-binding protein
MNNVCLVGRLTKEVETRYTANNNTAVSNFTLAVDRRFKKDGQPEADFLPIVTLSKTAEFCGKYFKKGMRVFVTGSIQTRSWDDQEGKKHYATEIIADSVGFADGAKNDGGNSNNTGNSTGFTQEEDNEDSLPF